MTVKIDGGGPITGGVINPLGQCRLVKSGTPLVLLPYKGALVTIAGSNYQIPAAGVSLAPTGTAANTNYLIYLLQTAGVLSLEYATTAHATDTATNTGNQGQEIKLGDPSRTLVGQARTAAAGAWVDTEAQRFVISWFNRRGINTKGFLTAQRSTTAVSPTFAEPTGASEIRNEFLVWAGDMVDFNISGAVFSNTNGAQMFTGISIDGATPLDGTGGTGNQGASSSVIAQASATGRTMPTEGYHYATLFGAANVASTTSWAGGATAGLSRLTLQGTIQG